MVAIVPLSNQRISVVARAVDLVHARLDHPVTLAELAAEAGLSRFHLLRLFRQQTAGQAT